MNGVCSIFFVFMFGVSGVNRANRDKWVGSVG